MISLSNNTVKVQVTKVCSAPKKYYDAKDTIKSVNEEKRQANFLMGLSAVMAAAIIACSVLAANFSLGYEVKVNETVVGTVATKGDYYEVLDEVKTEVKNISDIEFETQGEESFSFEIVKRSSLTEKDELRENLKATSDEMAESFAILADGEFVAALSSEEEAKNILDTYLLRLVGDNENITAEFVKDVKVEKTYVPKNSIKTKEDVFSEFLAGKAISYEPQENETLSDIASKYNITEETIKETNNLTSNEIFGTTLVIYTGEPFLSVKTVEHITGEFEIPFETVSEEDKNLYRGRTEIDVKGICGTKYVDSYVTKIDGEVTEENIVEEKIIKEPVNQEQRVGTKEPPPSVGTGKFVMPTSGRLTSNYGSRWGRKHAGIDVAAKTGTPIYAADNGIVTEAQYKNNGYGNFIAIDHGNGFVTYYAHCSEIKISEGDVVAKGDLIATVGNTGRSTGPHLHFEVRLDGQSQNPLSYVK